MSIFLFRVLFCLQFVEIALVAACVVIFYLESQWLVLCVVDKAIDEDLRHPIMCVQEFWLKTVYLHELFFFTLLFCSLCA